MSLRRRAVRWLVAGVVAGVAIAATAAVIQHGAPAAIAAPPLPPGFREQVVLSGLDHPTNLEIAADGRIFVAEKRGVIKVFDGPGDSTPVTFADLRTEVFNGADRGLLGLALPPNFPADPWVYVLYVRNADLGGPAPKYPNDTCADLYQGTCLVTGRLARLRADGNTMTGSPQVLLDGWCFAYSSHSVGDLRFGPDGALYVSAGDGASWSNVDYGQVNGCADPPGGAALKPPTAEGGALRAQDVRTTTDPTGYNGAVLRLDPATGRPLASNPGKGDDGAKRVVAHGLRNPYRLAVRPAAGGKPAELWAGDVGWNTYEEINRFAVPPTKVTNFGWPCYEGPGRQPGYDAANVNICENLYKATGAVTAPHLSYKHSATVVPNDVCPSGGSSVSGLAFYPSTATTYPAEYRGALFFADYARQCIWTMLPGADGVPSPSNIRTFTPAAMPVDLEIGRDTLLYYVDLGGTVRRFQYFAGNQPPIAAFSATPISGAPPLAVQFDAASTVDPDPADQNLLGYEWDFDYQPGQFTVDATGRAAAHEYATEGTFQAALRVKDGHSEDIAVRQIEVAAGKPTAVIDSPTSTDAWASEQTVTFAGHGDDDQDGRLPAANLSWELILHHCYPGGACHEHPVQTIAGAAEGSFVAPDHEFPAYLELRLTVVDSEGKRSAASVLIKPRTVQLTITARPAGAPLTLGGDTLPTPFTRTVIVGSSVTVSAPTALALVARRTRVFTGWSDGGEATHTLVVPETDTTLIAEYRDCPGTVAGCLPVPPPTRGNIPR